MERAPKRPGLPPSTHGTDPVTCVIGKRRLVAVAVAAALLPACNGGDDAGGGGPARGRAAPTAAELPVPRTEVSGVAWRGRLLVLGGLTADGGGSDLVHLYDPERDRWEPGPRLPVRLHHAGLGVLGDRVWVVGGYTNGPGEAWRPVADAHSLGPADAGWRPEAPLPAGPRGALAVAATGDALVAVGGEAGGKALATTEVYEARTRAWRRGPDLEAAREHLAAAAAGGRVYAIAGRTPGGPNLASVESLDPDQTGPWRPEPSVGHPRGGIAADAVGDTTICVAGGEEAAGTIASVECLEGDGWRRAGGLARPRHGLAVMALRDRLHVVAGGEQPGLTVSGVHEVLAVDGR